MDDATFWGLIDRARDGEVGPQAPSADSERLRAVLEGEEDAAVAAFAARFEEELVRLNRWSVWGAGYVVYGGMSDDSFHYFRAWLIGKGRAAVERALADPDGLGEFVEDPQEVDNEWLEYVAGEVMEARGGEDPRDGFEGRSDDEPVGERFEEETVYGKYPRLAAAFG